MRMTGECAHRDPNTREYSMWMFYVDPVSPFCKQVFYEIRRTKLTGAEMLIVDAIASEDTYEDGDWIYFGNGTALYRVREIGATA